MDAPAEPPSSRRLRDLARQLRLYRPPQDDSDDHQAAAAEKVASQVGIPAPQTANADDLASIPLKKAAVLICLFEGDAGDFRVILTKRSSRLSLHSGEVALPGGKADPGDKDDVATAMREAKEEIGLDPSLVNVVTVMEPFNSRHRFSIAPVIGILADRKAFIPSPNPDEVETVFDVPLEIFLKDENRWSEEREWMGTEYRLHYFNYETAGEKHLIFGLTAWLLIKAAMLVFERQPAYEDLIPRFPYPKAVVNGTKMP